MKCGSSVYETTSKKNDDNDSWCFLWDILKFVVKNSISVDEKPRVLPEFSKD
jgi:hypothetical protein